MRLIDADKLVDELEELADSYVDINCDAFTRGVYNICRQQGVDAAIEVVKKQGPIDAVKQGEWADVNKNLPPLGKLVYVYGLLDEYRGWEVGTAFLDKSFGEYVWCAEDCYRYAEVRCWLEIPSIPPVPKHFK